MLQLHGVHKIYAVRGEPVAALRGVDLTIAGGVLTAVLGPSGSGKSTLLRVVAGFERPDRGAVLLAGRVLAGPGHFVRPERRGIGIVPQDGALFPHLDVAQNIGFGLIDSPWDRWGRARRHARAARIAELLELVGLPGYGRRRVDELSGGQQQRVALARALAPRPRVVLLDEPFSAIDAALRMALGTEVRDLLRRLAVTAVLVTHDRQEALSLADRVVVMRDGRIAQSGTPRQVYEQPADAQTARFVGDAMVWPGRVVGRADGQPLVACPFGTVPARSGAGGPGPDPAPGTACRVLIRPEQLVLRDATGGPGAPGQVVGTEYFGHDAMVTLRLAGRCVPAEGDGAAEDDAPRDPASPGGGVAATVRVRTPGVGLADLAGRPVRITVAGQVLLLG